MTIVSIIIPIYNVGAYVERCLSSIYNQDIDDSTFEVIAVNDGSTDDSSDEVRKFMSEHQNIRLIEKENGGVSSARNIGIHYATGKYVTFVDPDDIIMPDAMAKMMDYCRTHEDDIVICRSFNKTENKEVYAWNDTFSDDEVVTNDALLYHGYVRGSVCGGIYKLSFLQENDITFIEGMRNGEDTAFLAFAMNYSGQVKFKDISLYAVIGREGSASRVFNKERISREVASINIVDDIVSRIDSKSPTLQLLRYILRANLMRTAVRYPEMSYKKLCAMGLRKKHRIGYDGLELFKWKIRLMNLSPRLFYQLLRFAK